jgi:SagB-type dehydrogenase family enzyme
MKSDDFDLIHFFYENTKASLNSTFKMDLIRQPDRFKYYRGYVHVRLPDVDLESNVTLKKAILERRSIRAFTRSPFSLRNLALLINYSYGITKVSDSDHLRIALRPIPSAGGLYPTELYILALNVGGLQKGVYHYYAPDHSLTPLRLSKHNYSHEDLAKLFVEPNDFANASLCIILTSVLERTTWKYKSRGYGFALLEAGHLMQNICLISASKGIGVVPLGGFYDDTVADLLGVNPRTEPVLYAAALGNARKR